VGRAAATHEGRQDDRLSAGRVAVVEDDRAIGLQLSDLLGEAGVLTEVFAQGQAFLARQTQAPFDAALLDMRLPDASGLAILEALKVQGRGLPVIMLTGMTEERGLVAAFGLGAHDYVFKPFRPAELVARVQALLQRTRQAPTPPLALLERPDLTDKERGCAQILLTHLGQTVSREQLRQGVWRRNQAVDSRTIDTHVSRVRTKLGLDPSNGFALTAVYGVGYRLQKLA